MIRCRKQVDFTLFFTKRKHLSCAYLMLGSVSLSKASALTRGDCAEGGPVLAGVMGDRRVELSTPVPVPQPPTLP